MKFLIQISISFAEFIRLIEVIIWPITLLLALLFFRRNLAGIISNLGSVKAGASGFEMTFQEKLHTVANIIEENHGSRSKSATQISVAEQQTPTPYEQILNLRDDLSSKVYSRAQEHQIDAEGSSVLSLINNLKEAGAITIQKARKAVAFLDLTQSAPKSVDRADFNKTKELYNQLDF